MGRPLAVLAAVCLVGACSSGDGERYVGRGAAEVDPQGRPAERLKKVEPDEEVRARKLEDGRIELRLDECTLTTEPAVAGRAAIAPWTRCVARRVSATAEITVRTGAVTLDESTGTLEVQFDGEGRASRLDESIAVRYRYSFKGTRARP